MAGEWKTRVGNAAVTPVRMGLGAPTHALLDLQKTGIGLSKDYYDIALETTNEIQETFSEAGKRGKWYHKMANVGVIAPVGAAAKAVTGTVQSIVNPIVNGVVNTAKTGWGFLKNEWNSLASVFSKKPVSDFSFEKLKLQNTWKSRWHPKNMLLGGGAATAATVVSQPSESTPVVPMAAPVATMDETSQKTIADLTAKVDAQDKSNQQLQQNMVTLQEQMKQQTAMMQEQLKQQNALIQTLQANNTKQISQDAVANQVEEKLDSENESSKKKSLKHKQAA